MVAVINLSIAATVSPNWIFLAVTASSPMEWTPPTQRHHNVPN